MNEDVYDSDYFLRGKQTGKSLYVDYSWKPDLTIPMVCSIIRHLGILCDHTIVDFGCARGYTVRAFSEMGYVCHGVDSSKWAVENCDPTVVGNIQHGTELKSDYDWVIAKDVLEHVPNVRQCIDQLMSRAKVGLFVVVPLSEVDGQRYVVPSYECDVTHLHRFTLTTWFDMFARPGWTVSASYRVEGVKGNYWKPKWEKANGFLTARRG